MRLRNSVYRFQNQGLAIMIAGGEGTAADHIVQTDTPGDCIDGPTVQFQGKIVSGLFKGYKKRNNFV